MGESRRRREIRTASRFLTTNIDLAASVAELEQLATSNRLVGLFTVYIVKTALPNVQAMKVSAADLNQTEIFDAVCMIRRRMLRLGFEELSPKDDE